MTKPAFSVGDKVWVYWDGKVTEESVVKIIDLDSKELFYRLSNKRGYSEGCLHSTKIEALRGGLFVASVCRKNANAKIAAQVLKSAAVSRELVELKEQRQTHRRSVKSLRKELNRELKKESQCNR